MLVAVSGARRERVRLHMLHLFVDDLLSDMPQLRALTPDELVTYKSDLAE